MTRTLTFGTDDGKRFELLYAGFVLGGNTLHQQTSRAAHERKQEAKILRAFKAVSDPAPANGQPADESVRRLRLPGEGELVVALEQDQLDLLVKYVEACPFLTHVSDQVDELLDWLHATPRA